MATFLEIVRDVCRESGTIADRSLPDTVVDQTGRVAKMIHWTDRAWRTIQTHRPSWLWMRGAFSAQTLAGQHEYQGALPRFGRFLATQDRREDRFSLFDPDEGRGEEGPLGFVPFDDFYATFRRGSNADKQGKPVRFTISPSGTIAFWPTPDKTYTVRGPYMRSVQKLSADADIPEMPEQFHDLIMYRALKFMAQSDEAVNQLPSWSFEELRLMSDLERDQLPPIEMPGAFA